jgi:hypothetical protein
MNDTYFSPHAQANVHVTSNKTLLQLLAPKNIMCKSEVHTLIIENMEMAVSSNDL